MKGSKSRAKSTFSSGTSTLKRLNDSPCASGQQYIYTIYHVDVPLYIPADRPANTIEAFDTLAYGCQLIYKDLPHVPMDVN